MRDRETERDRQTDRQTDRQKDTHTHKHQQHNAHITRQNIKHSAELLKGQDMLEAASSEHSKKNECQESLN